MILLEDSELLRPEEQTIGFGIQQNTPVQLCFNYSQLLDNEESSTE